MIRELATGETHLAYRSMLALRPNIGSESDFVKRIDEVQRREGYRLIARFVDGEEQAIAAAGFRVLHFLAWGDALYCDDLTTLPEHRGHGYAGALLDWMVEEAAPLGFGEVQL